MPDASTDPATTRPGPLYELRHRQLQVDVVPTDATDPSAFRSVYETAWTLHGYDYDDDWPDVSVAPYLSRPADKVDEARQWAERFIYEATPYQVTGWDGMAPRLIEVRHTVTAKLCSGRVVAFDATPREAALYVQQFRQPSTVRSALPDGTEIEVPLGRDVITHRSVEPGGAVTIVTINLNHVETIEQEVHTVVITRIV